MSFTLNLFLFPSPYPVVCSLCIRSRIIPAPPPSPFILLSYISQAVLLLVTISLLFRWSFTNALHNNSNTSLYLLPGPLFFSPPKFITFKSNLRALKVILKKTSAIRHCMSFLEDSLPKQECFSHHRKVTGVLKRSDCHKLKCSGVSESKEP